MSFPRIPSVDGMASVTGNAGLERSESSTGPSAPVPAPALQGLRRRSVVPATNAGCEHEENGIVSASNVPGENRFEFAGLETDPFPPCRRSAGIYEASQRIRDAQQACHAETLDAHYRNLQKHLHQHRHIASAVTEYKGEMAATEWMKNNHPEAEMLMGFKAGHGYDQVWVIRDQAGNPETYFLIEAKGPGRGAKLGTQAEKGEQMGIDWIHRTNSELMKSADPDVRQLGHALRDAIYKGTPEVRGLALKNMNGTLVAGKIEIPANEYVNSVVWRSRLEAQGPGAPERDGLATEGDIKRRLKAQEKEREDARPTIENKLDPEIVKQLRSVI